MNEKLDKELCEKYPVIFRDRGAGPKESCMHWGMDCGDGWFGLLDKMCAKISVLAKTFEFEFVADQIKEKYGELRIYWHTNFIGAEDKYDPGLCNLIYDIVEDIVDAAARRSHYVCEKCGDDHSNGIKTYGGWMSSYCGKCVRELGYERPQ